MTEAINVVMRVWHPKCHFLQGLSHISENIRSKQNSALSFLSPNSWTLKISHTRGIPGKQTDEIGAEESSWNFQLQRLIDESCGDTEERGKKTILNIIFSYPVKFHSNELAFRSSRWTPSFNICNHLDGNIHVVSVVNQGLNLRLAYQGYHLQFILGRTCFYYLQFKEDWHSERLRSVSKVPLPVGVRDYSHQDLHTSKYILFGSTVCALHHLPYISLHLDSLCFSDARGQVPHMISLVCFFRLDHFVSS